MLAILAKWLYVCGYGLELALAHDPAEVLARAMVTMAATILLWPLWKAKQENH